MKKVLIPVLTLLMSVMTACNFSESTNKEDVTESNILESSQTIGTTEKTIQTEVVTENIEKETTATETILKAEKLNLGEVDEWNFNSRSKFIYFTDYGRYYPVEIGGRQSANYVLCLDRGDGAPEILTETEDSYVMYCEGNSLYLSKHFWLENKYVRYKLENGDLTEINNFPFDYYKYLTDEYTYYYRKDKKI